MGDLPPKRKPLPTAVPLEADSVPPRQAGGPAPPPILAPRSGPAVGEAFAFDSVAAGESRIERYRRQRRPAVGGPVLAGGVGLVMLVATICLAAYFLLGDAGTIALKPPGDQQIDELAPLQLTIVPESAATHGPLTYRLKNAPPGATIDPQSGVFSWTPAEAQGPGLYDVVVQVAASGDAAPAGESRFAILVNEVNQPPVLHPIEDMTVAGGSIVTFTAKAEDPDTPARSLNFRLSENPAAARIDADTGRFEWNPLGADPEKVYRFTIRVTEAASGGLSAEQSFAVRVAKAEIPAEAEPAADPAMVAASSDVPEKGDHSADAAPAAATPAEPTPGERADEMLLSLYRKRKLLVRTEYPTLRRIFAERFEQEHAEQIKQAFGTDYDSTCQWLDAHGEIKEEFYTAISPEHDNVVEALVVFHDLLERFPGKVPIYPQLAIATAVVWDQPREGVYDYVGHQRRTHSILPEGRVEAAENFEDMISSEKYLQLRAQYLPWEFLVHVINHRTPLAERQWARADYIPKIFMYGKCYKEVPYDEKMLESNGATTRLADRAYTLPNIRQFGGVCAMQADFASRVGKSLGVPAAYVGGESRYGGSHAWVMWVELSLNVTKNQIPFSLQSEGRYRGDEFYVGDLRDPQTGESITDRQLELRLSSVGTSPQHKRHADLIMKAYPMLREEARMDIPDQLVFLNQLIDLCPMNEAAWIALAKMSRDGVVTKAQTPAMMKTLDAMFRTFDQFPDFTWQIFDDLVAFQDVPKVRARLFGQLVEHYEMAGRPDLACEARLKYTDYLVADERYKEAIEGLAVTIMKFPKEGRYVPRMLDRLEPLCQQVEGADRQLLEFYQSFLPLVPRKRGDRASPYCIEMLQRAIALFQGKGDAQWVQSCQAELARLQAGQPRP